MPKKPSVLQQRVKTIKAKPRKCVWDGPASNTYNGGVTQGLLSRYVVCKERFRLRTIEGLKSNEGFNHRLDYGNMWHTCEEALAANRDWEADLHKYCQKLVAKYPMDQEQVVHWWNVCKVQFPVYVDYWSKHPDVVDRTPLMQEVAFNVSYQLPSGRVAILRGKWDSVDLIGTGKKSSIWLQENKTKGDIDEPQIQRQISFDLQTLLYLIALETHVKQAGPLRCGNSEVSNAASNIIAGVRYNVVRRPLSGGKGSIRQHKPTAKNPRGESTEAFYERLQTEYLKAEPETYFMRWNVDITSTDTQLFKMQFLEPVLENALDDYEWWSFCHAENVGPYCYLTRNSEFPHHQNRHYRTPFGIFNPLAEAGSTDLDEHLKTGNETGLIRTTNLFPELQEDEV